MLGRKQPAEESENGDAPAPAKRVRKVGVLAALFVAALAGSVLPVAAQKKLLVEDVFQIELPFRGEGIVSVDESAFVDDPRYVVAEYVRATRALLRSGGVTPTAARFPHHIGVNLHLELLPDDDRIVIERTVENYLAELRKFYPHRIVLLYNDPDNHPDYDAEQEAFDEAMLDSVTKGYMPGWISITYSDQQFNEEQAEASNTFGYIGKQSCFSVSESMDSAIYYAWITLNGEKLAGERLVDCLLAQLTTVLGLPGRHAGAVRTVTGEDGRPRVSPLDFELLKLLYSASLPPLGGEADNSL